MTRVGNRYATMSDRTLLLIMKEAKKDAERALSGNSPIKMILYKMAEETHAEACDEYYKRCAIKGEG